MTKSWDGFSVYGITLWLDSVMRLGGRENVVVIDVHGETKTLIEG